MSFFDTINPEDSAKVYLYAPDGKIIGSADFYWRFGMNFTSKANEKYRILFTGGPPSPKKMIIMEIDYEIVTKNI